jgi:phosphate transport system ATP-binding protein
MNDILAIKNVNIWYNGLHAIKGVSMDIKEHAITAFIGASGSGKSTLLRSLNRMIDTITIARAEGEVLFQGKDVLQKNTDVIELRRKIGMVFQNPTPFPKSIYDNIAYGLEVEGYKNKRKGGLLKQKKIFVNEIEASKDPVDQAVVRSLKEAALWDEVKDRLHVSAYRLSGGQQQRLCIARAIAVRPEVLLLDEPCSELDPISTRKIEQLLLELKKDYTIVIVTHNMHQARRISDKVAFFHLGDLVEFRETKELFSTPKEELTREYVTGAFG